MPDRQHNLQSCYAVVNRLDRNDVEAYLRGLRWSKGTPDEHITLVAGNIRGFLAWLAQREHVVIEADS